jgi:hypothetical protein
MRSLLGSLALLLLTVASAGAVDYGKIDRSLRKEPAYKSRAPKYALLLFGREAKMRVWAILDGETLYLDRNGDGDLTGPGERFARVAECKDVEIADPDGKTRYVITSVGHFTQPKPPRSSLMVNVDVKGPLAYQQYCDVELRAGPRAAAAVAHFHGPLTAGPRTLNWKLPPKMALERGEKAPDLNAVVGTMDAKAGCWVVVRSHRGDKSAFAKDVCPLVDVEFPARAPGGPPVKKRYRLDKFC